MATFYGSDSYCLTDLQRISTQVTEPRIIIGQRLARRYQTPRGALALINGDPDFGYDVRQLVNAKLAPQALRLAENEMTSEGLKDEEVLACVVSIARTDNGAGIRATVRVVASDGPFTLVLNASDVTVDAIVSLNPVAA